MDDWEKKFAKRQSVGVSRKLIESLSSFSGLAHQNEREAIGALASGADVNYRNTLQRGGLGSRPLHLAAENFSAKMVGELLARGAKVDTKKPDGSTALHLAVKNNVDAAAVVDALVAAGTQVDALDQDGWTPLARALSPQALKKAGGFAAAERLLAHGASWDAFENCKKSHPLAEAAEARAESVVEFMEKHGAPLAKMGGAPSWPLRALVTRGSYLYMAEEPGRSKQVAKSVSMAGKLIEAGCVVDDPELINLGLCADAPKELLSKLRAAGAPMDPGGEPRGSYGPGPAMLARKSRLDQLLVAFELGLDKQWSLSGKGLLAYAMETRYVGIFETVEGLLKAGCDPNGKDGSNLTPLLRALFHDVGEVGPRVAKMLVEAGADVEGRCGSKNSTPLAQLVSPRNFGDDFYARPNVGRLAAVLVELGADVNQIVDGMPLLCWASNGDLKALISLGARPGDAIEAIAKKGDVKSLFNNRHQIDCWIAAGASPDDFLKSYKIAFGRMGEAERARQEKEGLLSYLEALSLKQSVRKPEAPAEAPKPLRM